MVAGGTTRADGVMPPALSSRCVFGFFTRFIQHLPPVGGHFSPPCDCGSDVVFDGVGCTREAPSDGKPGGVSSGCGHDEAYWMYNELGNRSGTFASTATVTESVVLRCRSSRWQHGRGDWCVCKGARDPNGVSADPHWEGGSMGFLVASHVGSDDVVSFIIYPETPPHNPGFNVGKNLPPSSKTRFLKFQLSAELMVESKVLIGKRFTSRRYAILCYCRRQMTGRVYTSSQS